MSRTEQQVIITQSKSGLIIVGILTVVLLGASAVPLTICVLAFQAGHVGISVIFLLTFAVLVCLAAIFIKRINLAIRNKRRPVLAFDADGLTYFSGDFTKNEHVLYKDICKVAKSGENYKEFRLDVFKSDGTICGIVANGMELSGEQVFMLLKERCSHLAQPYNAVLLLS